MVLDFDSVGDGYVVLPAGTYLIRVKKWDKKKSQAGNDMIQWTGIVIEGPHIGAPLSDFCALTDAAIWKIGKFIKCAGVDISGKVDTESPSFLNALNACMGQSMYWNVSKAPNNKGNESNKVEGYAADPNQEKVVPMAFGIDDVPEFARG